MIATVEDTTRQLLAGVTRSKGVAYLVLDSIAPAPIQRTLVPVAGWSGTLARMPRRLCVGRFHLGGGGAEPCPDRAEVPGAFRECFACRSFNGFNPAFDRVDPSTLSPQQKRYNARPHAVYLAHFGGAVVKVGMSRTQRIPRRLVEQGARAGVRLAETEDAWAARSIEVAVRGTGIPEVVHDVTKRKRLREPFDVAAAEASLLERAEALRSDLGLSRPPHELVPLRDAHLGGRHLRFPLVDLTDERPLCISGTAVGLIGKVLVTEQRGLHFAASLTRFIGHVVEHSAHPRRNPMPAGAGQLSLLG